MATYTPLMLTVADGIMNDLAFEVNADLTAALAAYGSRGVVSAYQNLSTPDKNAAAVTIAGYEGLFKAKEVIDAQNAKLIPNSGKFAALLLAVDGHITPLNEAIKSTNNAGGVAASSFTSMDNFTTGNISLVCKNPQAFAEDLANTGELLDFENLTTFGTPQSLFAKLVEFNLLSALRPNFDRYKLNVNQLVKIFKTELALPIREQRAVYEVAKTVTGQTLRDILIVMGIKTSGIDTLADLIDVSKIFPTAKPDLQTLIKGNVEPIFTGNGVSQAVSQISTEQTSVVPEAIAVTSAAMRNALFQIKGITNLTPQALAEQAGGIELNTGLSDVSGASSPIDPNTVSSLQGALALGSGPQGIYLLTDGVGSATGLVHLNEVNALVSLIDSTDMTDVIDALTPLNLGDLATALAALPASATSEQDALYTTISSQISRETGIYNELFGDNLSGTNTSALGFASNLHPISSRTDDGDIVHVINQVRQSTPEGQAVDACMREGRNLSKLNSMGVGSDSVIPT